MTRFPAPLTWIQSWAVASQQRARRNAMIASTALAHRRAERLEVEEYLTALGGRIVVAAVGVEQPAPAAHA